MATRDDLVALTTGRRDRRLEVALTSALDEAIRIKAERLRCNRSDAARALIAEGALTNTGLAGEAIRRARD